MQSVNWATWKPKETATLCFVRQGTRVLMIRKKRGLGAGKINGVGGRLEPGETPETGIVREAEEELLLSAEGASGEKPGVERSGAPGIN